MIGEQALPWSFGAIEADPCDNQLCFGCYDEHYVLFCGIVTASLLDLEVSKTCSLFSYHRGPCLISFLHDYQFPPCHKRLHLDSIFASLRRMAKLLTSQLHQPQWAAMSFSDFSEAQFLISCAAYLILLLPSARFSSCCNCLPLSQNWKMY